MKKKIVTRQFWLLGVLAMLMILLSLSVYHSWPWYCGVIITFVSLVWVGSWYSDQSRLVGNELTQIFDLNRVLNGYETATRLLQKLVEHADDPIWRKVINDRIRTRLMQNAYDARQFVAKLRNFAGTDVSDKGFIIAPEIKDYWTRHKCWLRENLKKRYVLGLLSPITYSVDSRSAWLFGRTGAHSIPCRNISSS